MATAVDVPKAATTPTEARHLRAHHLVTVEHHGDAVAVLEVELLRAKRARNKAIRHAVTANVPVAQIADASHLSRDWIYKIAAGHDE